MQKFLVNALMILSALPENLSESQKLMEILISGMGLLKIANKNSQK